jgi:hypothetical protein
MDHHYTRDTTHAAHDRGKIMDVLILLGILVVWLILQTFVLPRLGVST